MACRKMAFRTEEDADRTAAIIDRLGLKPGGSKPRRLYLCPECDLYHWTSMTEEEFTGEPATGPTCSRCEVTATSHCEDCGKPVCGRHTVLRGPLGALRHTCGCCLSEPDLPAGAPPIADAPVALGPFAKVVLPSKQQPWVRKESHRPASAVVASRVLEVVPPPPPAKTAPVVETPQQRHARECREAQKAAKERAHNDFRWLKNRLRDVYRLGADLRTREALALVEALIGMPEKMHPGADPDAAERWLSKRVETKLKEWDESGRFRFVRDEPDPVPTLDSPSGED